MLKRFLDSVSQTVSDLTTDAKKFVNSNMLSAYMAGAALVAIADGEVSPEEKEKMKVFINEHPALSVFNRVDVLNAFNRYLDALEKDRDHGEAICFDAIAKMKKRENEARLIVRMVISIGKSDGDFDDDEQRVVGAIVRELGLKESDFLG